jgi:hypothetical protein
MCFNKTTQFLLDHFNYKKAFSFVAIEKEMMINMDNQVLIKAYSLSSKADT